MYLPTTDDLLTRAKLSRDLIPDFAAANKHPSIYEAANRNRKVCADALSIAQDDWQYHHHSPASLPAAAMERAISSLVDWCWCAAEDQDADRIVGPAEIHAMANDYRAALQREARV